MDHPYAHIIHQRAVIAALGRTAAKAVAQRLARGTRQTPFLPGPTFTALLPPPPAALIDDYLRHVGAEPAAYPGTVPPHLWPQWGFPWAARTLEAIPFPLLRVLNGGCRLEVTAPIPRHEHLHVRARLENIDNDGRRAVLHQVVETGTDAVPVALTAHLYAVVPLRRRGGGEPKEEARVPTTATEVERWSLPRHAGLDFAMLTGDFNPVHWVRPWARMFGFKSTILHGFSTMARAMEAVRRQRHGRDLRTVDVKFTRPLALPADPAVFLEGDQVFVGNAPGEPAFLVGSFTTE